MSVVEVVPIGDEWVVQHNGVPKRRRSTKRQARQVAERLADRWNASLRVHSKSGTTRETHEFRLFRR